MTYLLLNIFIAYILILTVDIGRNKLKVNDLWGVSRFKQIVWSDVRRNDKMYNYTVCGIVSF